jgi:hypothetical protein
MLCIARFNSITSAVFLSAAETENSVLPDEFCKADIMGIPPLRQNCREGILKKPVYFYLHSFGIGCLSPSHNRVKASRDSTALQTHGDGYEVDCLHAA